MKFTPLLLVATFLFLISCKTDKKPEKPIETKEYSIMEKVANASGFENWKHVSELRFTFNVDRDTSHFERTWIWDIKKNQVTSIINKDTISYDRSKIDTVLQKTDGGFINDKYWLLAPFNLIWDKNNFTEVHKANEIAPISKKSMQKLTIVYGSEGGYTPGDAYDFYFGDDFIIKEWVFRKGNQPEPSLVTTWEDYVEKGGLKIAQMHKNNEGFKLYFSDIGVQTK